MPIIVPVRRQRIVAPGLAVVGGAIGTAALFDDRFPDANGTNLHGKAPNPGPGNAWSVHSGAAEVLDGMLATVSGGGTTGMTASADMGAANVTVECDILATTADALQVIAGRLTDANNCWWASLYQVGNEVSIYELNGGGLTQRAVVSLAITANVTYRMRAVFNGNSITVYVDGVEQTSYGSASFQNTATRFGVRLPGFTSLKQVDNYLVTAL